MPPETHREPLHPPCIEVQGVYGSKSSECQHERSHYIPSGGVARSQHRSGLKSWLCPLALGKFLRLSLKLAPPLFLTCCPQEERRLVPKAPANIRAGAGQTARLLSFLSSLVRQRAAALQALSCLGSSLSPVSWHKHRVRTASSSVDVTLLPRKCRIDMGFQENSYLFAYLQGAGGTVIEGEINYYFSSLTK